MIDSGQAPAWPSAEGVSERWNAVYAGDGPHSWDQIEAGIDVDLLAAAEVRPSASVLDVGGGDGALAASLSGRGFSDLTVLDISEHGLSACRNRVGPAADRLTWVVADIRSWRPERAFEVWHDRAVFHFLVDPWERAGYGTALVAGTAPGSLAVIGTFADDGPSRCSGLPVARYDTDRLFRTISEATGVAWSLLCTAREEHRTPAGGVQPFTWVVLRRTD